MSPADREKMTGPPRSAASRGFTLIELIVVMCIMTVLLSMATLYFYQLNQKTRIESQVRQMQADFEDIRLRATTTRRNFDIVLNPASYAFVSYSSESDPGRQLEAKTPQYPIQRFVSGSYSDFSDTRVSINGRGWVTSSPVVIAVAPGVRGPAINAVSVQWAKTNVGVIEGANCVLK